MTTKRVAAPKPPPTKRQLSRWQRQRRRQRITLWVGVSVIGCIAGLLSYGYYDTEVKPLHQTVVRVNEVDFDMAYFIQVLCLYPVVEQNPLIQNALADQMVVDIQNSELIRQGASLLNIGVTAEEIEKGLEESNLPPERACRDMVEADLLIDKLREGYFEVRVPRVAPQVRVQAMLLDGEEEARGVIDRLTAGEDFATLAGELSQDSVTKEENGELGWLPEGRLSPQLDQAAFNLEPGILSEPIYDQTVGEEGGYWIIKVLEKDSEREIDSDIREELKSEAINDWVSEQRERSEVESYLDEEKRAWAIERAF